MSKNRIAKLLLALGIGAVTAATGVAAVGCAGKCNPDNGPGQEQPKTEYTVKYDLNYDGATGAPQNEVVEQGGKLTEPKGVTRQDYTLDGWYTEATGGTKWNFDTDTVTKSLTLYAHWTSNGGVQPGPGGEVTADGTLALLTADNFTAFGEGDSGENDVPDVEYEVKADKKLVLSVPADAGECYLVAIDAAAFTNEGQSDKTFDIKIGENTVTYSAANDWGVPPEDLSVDPVDFTSIKTIEVTATADVTIHIALAPKTIFEGGSEEPGDEYEVVTSSVDFAAEHAAHSAVLTEDYTFGRFTIKNPTGDTKFEDSTNFKWQGGDIYFTVRGKDISFTMQAKSGSGSGAGVKLVKVTAPAAEDQAEVTEDVKQWGGKVTSTVPNWIPAADNESTGVAAAEDLTCALEEGTYKLVNINSVRISKLVITEKLPKGTPTEIRVSGATQDFVVGDAFDSNGLNTVLVYDNAREDVVTATSVDSSAVQMGTSGAYDVTVKYTYEKTNTEFTATYKVYVYKVDDITVNSDRFTTGTQSAAGNGIYFNEAMQEFYFVGEQLNNDGLSVTLHCSVNGVEGKTKDFYDRTFTAALQEGQDMATAGKKTVKVTSYGINKELTVYVAEKPADIASATELNISVDSQTPDAQIGTLVSGSYKFATIQQALDFLDMLNLDVTVKKTITLAAETYTEKVEVTIPNLTIKGTKDGGKQSTIEYDALLGLLDPAGNVHVTDSTATLAVRDTAEGFVLDGVIVNNKYCTQAYFDEKLGKNYSEHRALAVLIMADKVIIKDCQLNGYQDTIELFKGRQLIQNTLITGLTDFIFGTNNTTYFENCEIKTIKADRNAADRTGLSSSNAHGGYITAFKGNNKDANDAVKYGAVFVGCNFTAEDGVADGLMAIGRPWGAYAKVAVIECTLGKHIAKTSTGTASQDERYVTMSGNAPTLETVEFREYNNTGDGKIDEEVAGMKFLTADEAAQYKNKSVVFGTTNGKVTYDDVWAGEAIAVYTLTIKNTDDEEIYTGKVIGGTVYTSTDLKKLVPENKYPTDKEYVIEGFYTDKACTAKYDYKAVSSDLSLYVKFEEFVATEVTVEIDLVKGYSANEEILSKDAEKNGVVTITAGGAFTAKTGSDITWKPEGASAFEALGNNGAHVQSSAGGGVALKFTLEAGYTYTIKMWTGSSGGGTRNLTITGDATKKATGAGKALDKVEWTNLAGGKTYEVSQDGNARYYKIIVIATPVEA